MNILKVTWFRNLIILAILLRLLLMPFFFHPDIKTYHFQSSFLKSGVFDIYKYLENSKDKLPLKEEFVYFPLTYFFLGSYQAVVLPLLGDKFNEWLFDASGTALHSVESSRYLFILKLPYLFFDLAVGLLIMRFFINWEQKKRALTLWLFNPFTLILIYIFSNIDIIVVFLTLFSILLAKEKKVILSGLLLGLAAGFKAYPLIFLPFLLLYSKNIKQGIWTAISTLGVLAAIIIPFYSPSFNKAALVSGLTTRIVFPGLSIGFGETLMAGIILLAAFFFVQLLKEEKNVNYLWKVYLSTLLLVLSFIHFHIQWLLWAAPFLVILLVNYKRFTPVILLITFAAFLIPFLFEDKFMSFGLFNPISSLYSLLPLPYIMVSRFYDPYVVQSILHSVLAGGSLVLIWEMERLK